MSPLEREDRVQVIAKELLLRRSPGYTPHTILTHQDSAKEVELCLELAEAFVSACAERKEAIPLPLPPKVDLSEPEAP